MFIALPARALVARSEPFIKLYSVIVRECAVLRFRCSKSSYTPNSLKTILGAFSCAYRYVMDERNKSRNRSRSEKRDGRKTAQKENDNLCSLPIVKPCEYAII